MRVFLIWLALACLLPGIISAIALFVQGYQDGLFLIDTSTTQTARALVQAVDNQILRAQALAEGLATDSSLTRGDLAQFHRRARQALQRSPLGASIVITDRTGQQLSNTRKEFGEPLPLHGNPEMVRRVFETARPVVSDLFGAAVAGRPTMAVGVPVLVDGKVAYALTISVPPERFNGILSAQGLPPGWLAVILDSTSAIVARSRDTEKWVGKKPAADYLRQVADSDEGVLEFTMRDGVAVRSHFTRSPLTHWWVAVNIPMETLQGLVFDRLSTMALIIAALFSIAVGLAWLVGEKISRSVRALVAPAVAMGAGKKLILPPAEIREAAEVARAMGEAVRLLQERTTALQESEALFRSLTDTLPGLTFVADAGGMITYMNAGFSAYTGVASDGLLGRGWARTLHPADAEPTARAWEEAVATGRYYQAECRFRRHDGAYRWYLCCGTPIVEPDSGRIVRWVGVGIDMDDRKRAESEIQRRKEEFERLAENSPDVIARLDRQLRHLYISPAIEKATGVPADRFLGKTSEEMGLMPAELLARWNQGLRQALTTGQQVGMQFDLEGPEGIVRAFDCVFVPERGPDGDIATALTICREVTLLRERENQLQFLAAHDALTGLPNRSLLQERMQAALARCQRGSVAALLYLDLDHFKPVNDSLGHEVGDELLQAVAARMSGCVRKTDTVARIGGDEFAVLLDEIHDPQEAAWIAGNLLDGLTRPFHLAGQHIYISASIGIACCPLDAKTVDAMLRHADVAMYKAKEDGKNAYRFFSRGMDAAAREKLQLTASLKEAVAKKELALVYQPRVGTADGRIVGVEALIRWHSERGLILPARFVSLAEETGMIEPIGEWVLRTACRQLVEWNLSNAGDFCMAVNISARQFKQPKLVERIAAILEETGVKPASLELEITESAVMANPEKAKKTLTQLAELGIRLALDDFGTGHSSLAYLQRFPVHRLKIDQSFVADLPANRESANITRAIVAMARSLELDVTAEGVETEAQRQFLLEAGCDSWQGFLFSEPVTPVEIGAMQDRIVPERLAD